MIEPATPGVTGFVAEWRRVSADRAVFSLFVLAPCFTRSSTRSLTWARSSAIPIAVVDQDRSELGRALIQALEAHDNISVVLRASSYREAKMQFSRAAPSRSWGSAGYREERPEGCDGAAAGLIIPHISSCQPIVAGDT